MHFSIPDTQECYESNGSSYMGYNIHINGEYHCTVRYKQLFNFHEQLRRYSSISKFAVDSLPIFPPKRFWPLSSCQVEERRLLLEKYVQTVGHNPFLMSSDYFNAFFLAAQQESSGDTAQEIILDVYKMNGYRIRVNVMSDASSDVVLEKVCEQINLPIEYIYYFSLFLTKKDEDNEFIILRRLQRFESPYLSQKTVKDSCKITLRKSCWDPGHDTKLMRDRVALDLVYMQTVSDIERGWVLCRKETNTQLATLQATGAKEKYLEVARTLKYYGHVQFKECEADYPLPESKVTVSAGHRQLNLRFLSPKGELREAPFKVTRMKCWRITTRNEVKSDGEDGVDPPALLELSFEYLMTRDNLQWVTISSPQAILMSVCLQSIVDELLLQKSGSTISKMVTEGGTGAAVSYMRRDGSSQIITTTSSSSSSDTLSSTSESRSPSLEGSLSMRRLSEKLSRAQDPCVENDAFEGIGDDDL